MRWVLLPCQPQGRFLACPVALAAPRPLALGAAGCPSTQPEDQGSQRSRMRRMFYISHLLPRHRCHLALSQPGYFLPNASPRCSTRLSGFRACGALASAAIPKSPTVQGSSLHSGWGSACGCPSQGATAVFYFSLLSAQNAAAASSLPWETHGECPAGLLDLLLSALLLVASPSLNRAVPGHSPWSRSEDGL